MQERYIIHLPSAVELEQKIKDSLISGQGVPVVATKLGTFSIGIVNNHPQFVQEKSSVNDYEEDKIILHPKSIYTAVSETDFGRGVVSAVHGSIEEKNKLFTLTLANNMEQFDDIPTELVVEGPDSNSYL